jgi:hypothetical protein
MWGTNWVFMTQKATFFKVTAAKSQKMDNGQNYSLTAGPLVAVLPVVL